MSSVFGHISAKKRVGAAAINKRKMRLAGQQAFVCFYCGAIYENMDLYNTHVESMHYHER